MRTEKDLFTGATTYVMDTDLLDFSSFGVMPGTFRLVCSTDNVLQAVQVVTHPKARTVRANADELAAMADWELDPAELLAITDAFTITMQAALAPTALEPLQRTPVVGNAAALERLRLALALAGSDWVITELEVDA